MSTGMEKTVEQYNQKQRQLMLLTARGSILHGLKHGQALRVNLKNHDNDLQSKRACFVTVYKKSTLHGCIGHLQAVQPLILDVAQNAYQAAFGGPRSSGLKKDESDLLKIRISILSKLKKVQFESEADLLTQIQPEVDGIFLKDGAYSGTLLPASWELYANTKDFLNHLKLKAGLSVNHWSDDLEIYRYRAESFTYN